MTKYFFLALLSFCFLLNAQEDKDYGRIYGGIESNAQYYLDDVGLNFTQPDEPFRSNNYLFLNYICCIYKNNT